MSRVIAGDAENTSTDRGIMAAMAAASLDALITIDMAGDIVEFGPAAERLFGYARAEVVGRSVAEVVIPERLRQAHADGMARFSVSGEGPVLNNRVEVPAQRRNGEEFPAELTVVPLQVAGEPMFTAFVRDISERKRHEAELTAARDAAEKASAAKSRFLAHMSHELRSPLNAVLGAVDLMLDGDMSKRQLVYAQTARKSGQALLGLINEVLDFSRLEAEQVQLRDDSVDLAALVDGVLSASLSAARGADLELAQFVGWRVPHRVRGDAGRLRQILVNLVDNALKFAPGGGVAVRVDLRDDSAEQDGRVALRFEVEDTGPGIAPEQQQALFEEFVQIDDSDATAVGGAGLGLSIVRRLVKLMGGEIGVASTPGQGSCFWVDLDLPVERARHAQALAQAPTPVIIIGGPSLATDTLRRQFEDFASPVSVCSTVAEAGAVADKGNCSVLIDQPEGDDGAALVATLAEAGFSPDCVHPMLFPEQSALPGCGGALLKPCKPVALAVLVSGCQDDEATATDEGRDRRAEVLTSARILLAEDSPTNQLIAATMLRNLGCEVDVVADGQAAVDAVQHAFYDLVLMDLRMPGVDGLEATRRIRSLVGLPVQPPIIALTANALDEDIRRCRAAGMDDHVSKPIDRELLVERMEHWLQRSGTIVAEN